MMLTYCCKCVLEGAGCESDVFASCWPFTSITAMTVYFVFFYEIIRVCVWPKNYLCFAYTHTYPFLNCLSLLLNLSWPQPPNIFILSVIYCVHHWSKRKNYFHSQVATAEITLIKVWSWLSPFPGSPAFPCGPQREPYLIVVFS